MSKTRLTKEDIEHLAKLSNLQVDSSEIDSLSKQLDETISYVENLNELDTKNVEEKSDDQVYNRGFEDGKRNERQLSQEKALKNSKSRKDKHFVVTRIM